MTQHRTSAAVIVIAVGLLSGCAQVPGAQTPADTGRPLETIASLPEGADPTPGTAGGVPPVTAVTVEQFDTTSAAERAAAAAPPTRPTSSEVALGTTIASLGNPAEPGFWAETPLVTAVRQGRLDNPATGRSVQVELRPSGGTPGSGTRVSLPALRVLEAPLTALPELRVTGL